MRAGWFLALLLVPLLGLCLLALAFASPAAAEGDPPAPQAERGPLVAVENGPRMAPMTLRALDGSMVPLVAGDGVSVVHFFATWCEPCRAELPDLARFAARTPQVRVVLVDVAEVPVRVRRYLEGLAGGGRLTPGQVLLDLDRSATRAFGVSLIPATLVLADGHLALAREGVVDWDSADTADGIAALVAKVRAGEALRVAGPDMDGAGEAQERSHQDDASQGSEDNPGPGGTVR